MTKARRAGTGILGALVLLLAAVPLFADDPTWVDPRAQRVEDAVTALERAAATGRAPGEAGVALRHGHVRTVAGLARVDVVLQVENPGTSAIQWRRSFEIDPGAEVIGAVLQRGSGEEIAARTLSLEGARRIYREVTGPRERRTVPGRHTFRRGDPLRIERPSGRRLDVAIWPIAPGETVEVHLDFVTALRGRGTERTYRDVIAADLGGVNDTPRRGPATAPDRVPTPAVDLSLDTDWLVHAGGLELAAAPIGMRHTETVAGFMHFVAERGGPDRVPTIPMRSRRPEVDSVLAIPGGGLRSRIALWRFDPLRFVREHRLRVPRGGSLALVGRRGSTYRIAPHAFRPGDEPRPVTAELSIESPTLRYAVEIRRPDGTAMQTIEVEQDVERRELDADLAGAVTGWHRAQLVQRVLAWGRQGDARDQREALQYAVDMGVLAAGTAALAVPRSELQGLVRRSRTEYRRQVPLGAQDGGADFEAPPYGSVPR